MKKSIFISIIAIFCLVIFGGQAFAGPNGAIPLNWGGYLHNGDTSCPSGKPIINVTRKIINSLDSGTGSSVYGNSYWAYSDFNQNITVVETDIGYCATVTYRGKVESVGGDGPGCTTDLSDICSDATGLAAGVIGTFQGGFTRNLTGTFVPIEPTKGNLGTLDANCDAETAACDFSPSNGWITDYFPDGVWGGFIWWGWVYHAGKNGTWVNAADPPGNSGNITGE